MSVSYMISAGPLERILINNLDANWLDDKPLFYPLDSEAYQYHGILDNLKARNPRFRSMLSAPSTPCTRTGL